MIMKRTALLAAIAVFALSTGMAHSQNNQNPMTPSANADVNTATGATADTTGNNARAANTAAADVNAKPSMKTKSFIKTASEANMFEIETSKVALQNASSQQVKDFAQRMIDDHTKAGNDMNAAIGANTAMKGDVATSLGMMHKLKLSKLKKEEGASFDKDYVNAQVDAHDDAVKLFQKYADNGDDAALKTFAANTLPTLQEHKSSIDTIKSTLNQTSMK
jgi:putative membrane protein